MRSLAIFAGLPVAALMLVGCSSMSESLTGLFDGEEDKQQMQELAATSAKAAAEAESNSEGGAEAGLAKHLLNEATDAVSAWAESMVPGTEVSISGQDNGKPEYSVATIQEIETETNSSGTVFWQGQVSNHDGGDRTTVNLGLGYRRLSSDENWLFGANTFVDQEFPYDHQRASIGLEAKSAAVDLTVNQYMALSKWKRAAAGNRERALDGQEIEVGAQVPYVPSARLFLNSFKWNGVDSASDIEGISYSLQLNSSLGSGWVLEAGRKDFDSRPDEDFARITYRLGLGSDVGSEDSAPFISDKMFETGSVKHRTLEKVRRTNRIVKQTGGFKVSFR
ncbi:MAG TPA: hypothetical protein DD668_02010 [Alphaproteobacteria bacterium]|nr:hypothetical protein [Alphaproteobacteria bacterium]HCA91034.1 hypothetical protein [Alphaproteobacteria bacterium]